MRSCWRRLAGCYSSCAGEAQFGGVFSFLGFQGFGLFRVLRRLEVLVSEGQQGCIVKIS